MYLSGYIEAPWHSFCIVFIGLNDSSYQSFCHKAWVSLPLTDPGKTGDDMNAISEPATHPSPITADSLQRVAQWLKCNGGIKLQKQDPLQVLSDRYPAGLLSQAELEALLGSFHH